jgi:hypothetical protein
VSLAGEFAIGLSIALARDAALWAMDHPNRAPAENAGHTVAGRLHRETPHRQEVSNTMSAFDIVGDDDDDYGSIGLDPQFVGADDLSFLNSLVSGDLDALISGDGTSEIIGATKAAAKAQSDAKKKAALKQLAMRSAGAVIKRGLDRRRRYPLGVVPTTILSGSVATIPTTPQNLFRPERLVIPSDIAFDIGVTDVKVGNQSQFVETSEVPGSLFSEVAINTGVTFDTAEIGNQISVALRNKSLADVEFTAGFVGTIAK